MVQEGYMHVAEAARELGLTHRAVLARIQRGELKAERVHPQLYLIPRDEVERAKAGGRLKPGPKPRRETPTEYRQAEADHDAALEEARQRILGERHDAAADEARRRAGGNAGPEPSEE